MPARTITTVTLASLAAFALAVLLLLCAGIGLLLEVATASLSGRTYSHDYPCLLPPIAILSAATLRALGQLVRVTDWIESESEIRGLLMPNRWILWEHRGPPAAPESSPRRRP